MDWDRKRFAFAAKVIVGAIWVHALVTNTANDLATFVTSGIVLNEDIWILRQLIDIKTH